MKKPISRFYLLLVLVPLLLLASMGGYYFLEETAAGSDVVVVPQTPAPPSAIPVPVPTPEPTPTPFPEHDITLMAVGDNLMHLGIVASGKQEEHPIIPRIRSWTACCTVRISGKTSTRRYW